MKILMLFGGIIGSYFFKDEAGHAVIITGLFYQEIINTFFKETDNLSLNDMQRNRTWVQVNTILKH